MSQATRILAALALGLALGLACGAWMPGWVEPSAAVAEPIGGLWLDALRMTIIPLVVSLLITGIAASADAARAGRLAGRAVILFMAVLWTSAILSALLTPALLGLWPMPGDSAAVLRAAVESTEQPAATVPTFAQFVRSLVPTNPIAAAAEDRILPLMFFTAVFAFALTRLPKAPREQLTGFFRAVADTMLVIVGWVLRAAPLGVLALAYIVAARAGASALESLGHYVIIVASVGAVVWFLAWPLAMIGGRVSFLAFTRAVGPAHAVAISTQSSLASLPAMLRGAETMGVPVAASGVVLPIAVSLFRATGPAMNLAVAIYVAHWYGVPLTPGVLAAGVVLAATTTLGAVSLPGSISFITSIGPVCLAMGVPIDALVLLIAVETLPDIVRTTGNVSMDMAATATVARRSRFDESAATEEDRLLAQGA
ncbi:dicarboxylate/amino acid:cation symporter [Allosphingosinicella sp.]|jgi:Na+/H+-dicarboxylate symporter|uniref:dicarboxylate/amino acid:cation symporter n=1 Tax=Allosphingosinicella sp. TaxID=2823234 RepID=UPI002F15212A